MTQEQQTKLEQAAHDHAKQYRSQVSLEGMENISSDFKAGAQTILDNPSEWGLASMVVVRQLEMETNIQHKEKTELQSQLTKYREALETIAARWNKVAEHNEMRTALHLIQQDVFEALKNNEG